jgi:hypothetical protein
LTTTALIVPKMVSPNAKYLSKNERREGSDMSDVAGLGISKALLSSSRD